MFVPQAKKSYLCQDLAHVWHFNNAKCLSNTKTAIQTNISLHSIYYQLR